MISFSLLFLVNENQKSCCQRMKQSEIASDAVGSVYVCVWSQGGLVLGDSFDEGTFFSLDLVFYEGNKI